VILIDTNILVHATGAQSLQHAKAKELRDQAAAGQFEACIAAQILTEFYAVVTDPRRFQPPLTPTQAQREMRTYLSSPLKLILPKETTVTRMSNLLGSKSVKAGRIFDIFLAATMLDNGVQRIYTENVGDFQGITGIDAINPFPR
jgi:predicted nucleic acid-binding protein